MSNNPTPPNNPTTDPPRRRRTGIPLHRRHRRRTTRSPPPSSDPYIRMATYIAMAHACVALSLTLLYALFKVLQNYWRPIQWAILCSIPLRELHNVLVTFWSHSLSKGLLNTLISLPLSFFDATNSSLMDSHAAFLSLFHYPSSCYNNKRNVIGFSKLMRWLISFALFIVLHEKIGFFSIPTFAIPCFIAYTTKAGSVTMRKLSSLSSKKFLDYVDSHDGNGNGKGKGSFGGKLRRFLRSSMLRGLKSTVGICLIVCMIVGCVLGLVFFSYKILMEGKSAVLSLKAHLDENNYAGVKKWMSDNHVPELIDSYADKLCETVSHNIDSLAEYYNVTEIVDGMRAYFVSPASSSSSSSQSTSVVSSSSSSSSVPVGGFISVRPLSKKLHGLRSSLRNGEWKLIYMDVNVLLTEFVSLISREDLLVKTKSFLLQSLDVSKRLLASSSMVFTGGVNVLFFMVVSIVSGAAGLVNFISELMVFLWLLYYLITSDSGGVTDQVLEMVPISKSTRVRCAQVLDHAVASVLLAAAKVTLFQGCLTYLLFRFYRIHFLYMSTFLALVSAVLPITPALLSSIPAAAQLGMEARYVEAVFLTAVHQILLEYGTVAIQDEIPGQNAYLTGLSILGGIALFPYAFDGAIMGPLLMTVMIALKDLYVEFVLGSTDESTL